MFLGDISEERQAEIRLAIEDVMTFYDDRHDIVVPKFSLYISQDLEAADTRYRELTGGQSMFLEGWQGGFVTSIRETGLVGFIAAGSVDEGDIELRTLLAHEYYHLIQLHILRAAGASASSPPWLVEGMARYNEDLYRQQRTSFDARTRWASISLNYEAPFEHAASGFNISHYEIAAFAIDWLVDHSGNRDSHLEYWRSLPSGSGWQDAFAAAFGLTPEDFFAEFEEYRTELASAAQYVRGMVVDPDGHPLAGVLVRASSRASRERTDGRTLVDGTFALPVQDGEYFIRLGRFVLPSEGRPYSSIWWHLGFNMEIGYANSCDSATQFVVDGADVTGIVIKVLPDLLDRVEPPPCNEGLPGFHVIQSTVLGPDGAPLGGTPESYETLMVVPVPQGIPSAGMDNGLVRTDGSRVAVPDGSYILEIYEFDPSALRLIGWYGDGGFTAEREQATVIEVDGADVTGIEIRLPNDPADLPTSEYTPFTQ